MKTIRLHFDIGDKVYADSHTFGILEYVIDRVVIEADDKGKKIITYDAACYEDTECCAELKDCISFTMDDVEWSVFTTLEQAIKMMES